MNQIIEFFKNLSYNIIKTILPNRITYSLDGTNNYSINKFCNEIINKGSIVYCKQGIIVINYKEHYYRLRIGTSTLFTYMHNLPILYNQDVVDTVSKHRTTKVLNRRKQCLNSINNVKSTSTSKPIPPPSQLIKEGQDPRELKELISSAYITYLYE